MSLLVQVDDIQTGDYLAVFNGTEIANSQRNFTRPHTASIAGRHLPSGTPVHVLAMNTPFLMVTIVGTGGTLSEPLIVDAREMQFCRVNEEFLDTLLDRARETAQKPDANDIPF